jgi:hypothetical protein
MASLAEQITDAVIAAIEAGKATMPITQFTVEKGIIPSKRAEHIGSFPLVDVMPGSAGDTISLSRTQMALREQPVFIALTAQSGQQDNTNLWKLIEFDEELKSLARQTDLAGFAWIRNEAFRDPNETPMSYQMLSEGIFFTQFTAYYHIILSP